MLNMECALPLFVNVFIFSKSNKPSWELIKSDFFVAEIVLKDKKTAKLIVNYEESFYQHEICTQKNLITY